MTGKGKKAELLEIGSEIIRKQGFNNTGINEILEKAKVPKGSFYFYFKSKEDYGLQLLDYYKSFFEQNAQRNLLGDKPYLQRLKKFFEEFHDILKDNNYDGGCPIGNFALEMGDLNENFRIKILECLSSMSNHIKLFLDNAQKNHEISKKIDTAEMSTFILNSWEGTIMKLKVSKNSQPMQLFYEIVFENLLTQNL